MRDRPDNTEKKSYVIVMTYWWANSCATTTATRCFWLELAVMGSINKSTSRYVTSPQFSTVGYHSDETWTRNKVVRDYQNAKADRI